MQISSGYGNKKGEDKTSPSLFYMFDILSYFLSWERQASPAAESRPVDAMVG